MAGTSPSASGTGAPAAVPLAPGSSAATPSAPSGTAPAPAPSPRIGDIDDQGIVRRETIRAQTWNLDGTAKVLGDVDVGEARVRGIVSIRGKLVADAFQARGTLEVGGATQVSQELSVEGIARFSNPVLPGSLVVTGTMEVLGSVRTTGRIYVKGKLGATGEIRAGALEFEGRIAASGDVQASSIIGRLHGESRAKSIRAETIRIARGGIFGAKKNFLYSDRIEAREATLEGVECGFVRAERLTIGPNCHLTQVEGTIVSRHPSSQVGFESRSPPPHGLSR